MSTPMASPTSADANLILGEDSLDAAAQAVASVGERITRMLEQILAHMSLENVILQFITIAIAVVVGYWVSRRLNRLVDRLEPGVADVGFATQVKKLVVRFIHNVSFSFLSGCTLSLGAYILVNALGYHPSSLVLCRVAYSLFFAFALLSLVMECLQGMLGTYLITPKVRRLVGIVFWCLAVLQFFGILTDIVNELDSLKIPLAGGKTTVWTIIVAIFSVFLTLAVANWLANIVNQFIRSSESLSANTKVVLTRIITVGFLILAIIVGLGSVGIDLTVLSVFGGALGVGLGFGLQKIASNYISGFIILLDKSIKIGDLVTVGGFRGEVTEINTRYTVVRNFDGVENIVPNENFVTSPVMNYSYGFESCVSYINMSVAYGSNVARALEIMMEEGTRDHPRIDKTRKGWANIDSFGDSGINLSMAFWIKDPKNGTVGLKTQISLAIVKRFKEEGIEIPYNRLDINLREVDASAVPVRVVREGETATGGATQQ